MANRRFYQFLYSKVPMLTMIQGNVVIGASGAVSSSSGVGVTSVTKLATGIYRIKLQDNYNHFVGADFTLESPVTGGSVSDGSFVADTLYQITAVGTTDWASVGLPSDLTATVGQVFVASATGGAGSGTAKAVGLTGVADIEVAGVLPDTMLAPSTAGSYITIQCVDAAGALVSPASGSSIGFQIFLRNSSATM